MLKLFPLIFLTACSYNHMYGKLDCTELDDEIWRTRVIIDYIYDDKKYHKRLDYLKDVYLKKC